MINIPVSKPNLVKVATFVGGALALFLSQKYPVVSPLLNDLLALLGISGVAAGRPQIIQSPVKT